MHIALILDPVSKLNPKKDSSLAIMREAAQRGHEISVAEQRDILLRDGVVNLCASMVRMGSETVDHMADAKEVAIDRFDVVLMRKDPPFDNEYLYSTYLLELAEKQGALVLNRSASIRDWNEKLSVARFPQFSPSFLVTRDEASIRGFLAEHGDIVVKPLDGMGGAGVFRLTQTDPNIGAILETITQLGSVTVMAQRYLPEIKLGDKRILVINGKPLPYALARIPKAGETRGNLAAGGTGVAQPLSERDNEIANTIGPVLKAQGLFLVGLDVIGDYLTEINVTSPTCMVEIAAQTDCKPAVMFMDELEACIASA